MTLYQGQFTTPGTSADIWLRLDVSVASQSIADNQSTVAWSFYMQETVNANPYNLNPTSDGTASVNGTVFSSSTLTYDFRTTLATVNIGSGNTVVTHDADGTKSISISASYDGGSPIGTASLSGTFVLPTIPRNRIIVGDAGVWKTAELYVGVNGEWKMAQPYVGDAGVWELLSSTP